MQTTYRIVIKLKSKHLQEDNLVMKTGILKETKELQAHYLVKLWADL